MIDHWLQSVMSASVRGGIALAVAWIVCQVPRVPAAVRCWVWRAAYLVLTVSFFWTAPVDLAIRAPKIAPPVAAVTASRGPVESDIAETGTVSRPAMSKVAILKTPAVVVTRPVWPTVVGGLWLGFAGVYIFRLVWGWLHANRLRKGVDVDLPELPGLCRAMKVRPPAVRVHPSVSGPLLIGLWRPVVVLPESVRQSPDRCPIVAHELAHLKRQDLLWNWLPTLAMALLPVHPMVWIGNRRWRLAVESACDADALSVTKGKPVEYGNLLVNVATAGRSPRFGVLAVGVDSNSRWLLTRRLKAMRNFNSWNRRRMTLAGIVVGITAVAAAVPWRVVAQQVPETRPAAQVATSQSFTVTVDRNGKTMKVSVPDGGTLTLLSHKAGEGPTTQPVPVDAAMSHRFNQHSGRITAATADLVARKTGTLKAVAFQEGQSVKAGDLIFRVDDAYEQSTLDYNVAELKEKQLILKRQQDMSKRGVATESEVGTAELEVRLAESRVSVAKAELDITRVTAPFDGILLANDLQVGAGVTAGQKLATLIQTDQLKITLQLNGTSYVGLLPGMVLDAAVSPTEHHPAVVTYISPEVDPSGSRTVRARLVVGTQNLVVGSTCTVSLPETK